MGRYVLGIQPKYLVLSRPFSLSRPYQRFIALWMPAVVFFTMESRSFPRISLCVGMHLAHELRPKKL